MVVILCYFGLNLTELCRNGISPLNYCTIERYSDKIVTFVKYSEIELFQQIIKKENGMSEEIIEIIAGVGFGKVKFGMAREEVKAILGEPDEVDTFAYDDNEDDRSESWFYYDLNLFCSFDEQDDWRLISCSAESFNYQLLGKQIIGLEKDKIAGLLEQMEITDLEHEDHSSEDEPNHELIASDSVAINFWCDEGIVTEIQWGPLLTDDETVIWPK